MPPPRIAIVGLGVISRYYLEALRTRSSMRLVAVCDHHDAALAPFRDRVACYGDHREMLRDVPLDGLIVTVPNDVHALVCHDALQAGVAVCVEKPLATSLADAETLVAHARAREVPIFTAFHRRYNARVLELVGRSPEDPPLESLELRYLERIEDHVGDDAWYLDPARCGGGCVADNGPNAFDLVALFAGEMRVAGAVVRRDAHGIDRHAEIELRSASGIPARVQLDWSFHGECKEVALRFADGSTRTADMLAGFPAFKSSLWHEYVGVLDDFAGALRSPPSLADRGLAVAALVDAVYRAEQAGRAVGA